MGSDPRGAINNALYGTLNSPYQIGGDLLADTVCDNGPRLGRGMGNGGMAYLGTMHGAQRMLDRVIDGPPPPTPPRRGGAGGSWRTINERPDPTVVRQRDPLSCAAACGEMLLKDRGINITQDIIEKETGKPAMSDVLAYALNKFDSNASGQWRGATVDPRSFHHLNKTGSWAAMLWEPGSKIGHFVVVDGLDGAGNVKIRDPFHGTRYEMELDYFLNDVWTWEAVWKE